MTGSNPQSSPRRALFLDRDGVINEERDFIWERSSFVFCAGIFELVAEARSFGYEPVVVTNQSGIGRGLYSERQFQDLTAWMLERFEEAGAPIGRVYHCPYHPEAEIAEYRRSHPYRKPSPGMLLAAAEELSLSLPHSILIGDRWSDIAAAAAANVPCRLLVGHGYGPQPDGIAVSARVRDTADAARWLTDFYRSAAQDD